MQKIAIMGACGSGKSTLAVKLSKITGLKIIHLDQEFHLPNWVERGKQEWANIHANIIAKEKWIIDGCYSDTAKARIKRADLVIFFDIPTFICLYRVIKRIFLHYGNIRPDSAAGCNERLDFSFLLYVLNFRRKKVPNLLKIIAQRPSSTELFVIKSNKDIEILLNRFNMRSKKGNISNAQT